MEKREPSKERASVKAAIMLIDGLMETEFTLPSYRKLKKVEFLFRSYQRWALQELRLRLYKNIYNQSKDVITIIEEFRNEMDDYACAAQNGYANFMFSTSYDVAVYVMDYLI